MTVDDETQENPAPKPAPRPGPGPRPTPRPHPAAAPVPSAPHCDPRKFGRVDDDGTVWLISSAGERVIVVCDDETIRVYGNNTLLITYSSAANYKTAATGELESLGTGGLASDIIAWPRTLSGQALRALEALEG